jgi:hypothetical protein
MFHDASSGQWTADDAGGACIPDQSIILVNVLWIQCREEKEVHPVPDRCPANPDPTLHGFDALALYSVKKPA